MLVGLGVAMLVAWRVDAFDAVFRGSSIPLGVMVGAVIICAVGTYVVAQAIFIIVRAIRGNEIRWLAAFFNLTVVAVAGVIGGGMGGALRRRGFRPSSQRGHS